MEIQTMFDYGELSIETREFVKSKELSIKARTSQTIWENGRDLLEVKERLEHGQFMEWCGANFPWSHSTVNNMINVAVKFPTVGNLDISAKTLYLLAQTSTPESARQEAIEKAESGETISHKEAKELVDAHKRISNLEDEIDGLQSKLPTDDVKKRIVELEAALKEANDNPSVVPPPGYDQLKDDLRQAQLRARSLEESLIEEQKKPPVEVVPDRFKKLEEDHKLAQQQVKKLGAQLMKLSEVEDRQKAEKREIDAMDLLSDANKSIRKSLALLDSRGEPIQRGELLWNSIIEVERLVGEYKKNFNTMEVGHDIIDI
jgi:hypothetical protein